MNRVFQFCTSVFLFVVVFGFASNADAAITGLCVGCTSNSQFEAAAWQTFGQTYTQGINLLIVNPGTGLSKWVYLVHLPAGVGRDALPENGSTEPAKSIRPGVATPLDSNPFAAIYVAKDHIQQAQVTVFGGTEEAYATDVSAADQQVINTAIRLTEKTWFVQLNLSEFPSYEGSDTIQIANANYTALTDAGIGWPVSQESDSWFEDLLKVLGLYTGHSLTVCDVFANGDSVCVIPDPFDNDVYTQSGPAKDAHGDRLPAIGSLVAGGGGNGMEVIQNPTNIEYFLPPSQSTVICGYLDGQLSTCIEQQ